MVSEPYRASSSNQQTISRNSTATEANQHTQNTFSFKNPIKLDRFNYLLWRSQVLASIRGNRLEGFINGAKQALEESIHVTGADGFVQRIDNPEYHNWRSQDQTLLGWLLSSISAGTLNLVINCATSFDVWRTLERKFGVQSEARVLQLIYELNTIRKESLSVEDYCIKMKSIADKIASALSPITEKDLLLTILNGVGLGYCDIATFIISSKMEFDDAYALLLTHETRLEHEHDDKGVFNANYAYTNFRRGGHNNSNPGNFGGKNNYFDRDNINYPMKMHNGNSRSGYGMGHSFAPNINPNSFQTPRIPFQFTRNGFTGLLKNNFLLNKIATSSLCR